MRIHRKEFRDMQELQDFEFKPGEVISIESLPYLDKPERTYFRVWFWK